jgi:hypothetical protein
MPLTGSKKERFHEFRHGGTYARTRKKFGKKRANKQLVAVALNDRGKKRRKSSR